MNSFRNGDLDGGISEGWTIILRPPSNWASSNQSIMTSNTPPTRVSLIQYLCRDNQEAWQEADRLYRPMISGWLNRYRLQTGDVEDITQEVMAKVAAKIGEFDHNGRIGAFRNWLRLITVNTLQNHFSKLNRRAEKLGTSTVRELIDHLADPNSGLSRAFNVEHDQHILMRLLESVSSQFQEETLQVFRLHVLDGVSAEEVATQTGVGVHAIYMAKSRVLRALRKQAPDWLEELKFS